MERKKSSEHQPYDKIIKENLGQLFLPLAEKQLGIQIAQVEELKDKVQTTIEREGDFLRKLTTKRGDVFILHLEFQVSDEADMVFRMQEYYAILRKKYQLPIKQFVYYLGEKPSTMQTRLSPEEVYTGFELRTLHNVNYEQFFNSSLPEECMLAILAGFGEEKAEAVIKKILLRLQQLITEPILLEKYFRQYYYWRDYEII